MRRLVFALFILLVPCALHAQTLDVVISDPTVFVDFDNSGPTEVDLEFLFQIDSSAVLVGQGPNNGDLFSNLSYTCLLYTSPSPRDQRGSRMPSSA